MKISFYHRAIVLLVLLITAILSSCRCHVEDPYPLGYNYMNVPEGDTAVLDHLNIAGMGARKNNKNTTWIVKGHVVMDELHVLGHVVLEEGGQLNILGTLHVAEEAKITVRSELKYSQLNQFGTVDYQALAD
ncbi:MAG: hypothetical protein K0R51_1478 [Cytophagaceae bacterium]|jgi:hypothetical protein|nr:hypothetical protein [Cytophagaceae bacterium]